MLILRCCWCRATSARAICMQQIVYCHNTSCSGVGTDRKHAVLPCQEYLCHCYLKVTLGHNHGSCVLQIGCYAVPEGTPVHIGVYAMHHDERWWEDAERFKPERWLGVTRGQVWGQQEWRAGVPALWGWAPHSHWGQACWYSIWPSVNYLAAASFYSCCPS